MESSAPIRALEERLIAGMKNSDVATLTELVHDDLLFTGHNGQLYTKEMDLDAHRSGNIEIYDITVSEQEIMPYGDVIIVSVKKEISGSFFGETEVGLFRFTRVWKQFGSTWQVIAGHSTQISK